jgi:hypothetical protein
MYTTRDQHFWIYNSTKIFVYFFIFLIEWSAVVRQNKPEDQKRWPDGRYQINLKKRPGAAGRIFLEKPKNFKKTVN